MSKPAAGVDNTQRRKWDRDEWAEKARERERLDAEEEGSRRESRGPPVQRKPLQQRGFEIDLTSRLGKTQVVQPTQPLRQQAGYFCNVCDCVVKDSMNYLDHINGKKHQRNLGMSMRVERSTLNQVQERFESLKRKKDSEGFSEVEFARRIQEREAEEEERKRLKKEKKKEKRKEKEGGEDKKAAAAMDDADAEADMAAMMGFHGFGSSKK